MSKNCTSLTFHLWMDRFVPCVIQCANAVAKNQHSLITQYHSGTLSTNNIS